MDSSFGADIANVVSDGAREATVEPRSRAIMKLQVIYKTVERCNLACPYCYYFYGGDETYKQRPARTSRAVADELVAFLKRGVLDRKIRRLDFIFHGGEPMLQKLEDFDYIAGRVTSELGPICALTLGIQTNGTKITKNWLETLVKHKVKLSISMDGPAHVNDAGRYYHNGKGSYKDIAAGVGLIEREADGYLPPKVAVLTVLNAKYDYKEVVEHFAGVLGFKNIGVLLPDCSYDSGIPDGMTAEAYGRILCDIFDAWAARPEISVREISNFLKFFQIYDTKNMVAPPAGEPIENPIGNQIIVVQSDGAISIDDSYIPAQEWRKKAPVSSVFDTDLSSYLNEDIFSEIEAARLNLPAKCEGCDWKLYCRGGDFENRFSNQDGFDNPSIFCDGLKMFYTHAAKYLVSHGYPAAHLLRRLRLDA